MASYVERLQRESFSGICVQKLFDEAGGCGLFAYREAMDCARLNANNDFCRLEQKRQNCLIAQSSICRDVRLLRIRINLVSMII